MEELTHSNHAVVGANWHLQFTPKYRRPVFADAVLREACRAEFRAVADRLGVSLEACEFGPDHVRIFVSGARLYSPAELANRFKGASSRVLRRDLADRVSKFLRGDSLWSDGYFAESAGRLTAENVRFYIERQQGKHWTPVHRPTSGQTKLNDFAS